MSIAQDRLLGVIQDENSARVLADLWQKIEGSPLEAAKIVRALEQSSDAVNRVAKEIPEAWSRLDDLALESEVKRAQFIEDLRAFRKETLTELTGIAECVRQLKGALADIDEDKVLNKANRVLELAERLAKAKRDGTLEILKRI